MSKTRKPGPFRLRNDRYSTAQVYADVSRLGVGPTLLLSSAGMKIRGAKRLHRWLGRAVAWMEQQEEERSK